MKTNLAEIMKSLAEVANDHDVEGMLSYFTDDAVVKLANGQLVFRGRVEMRKWIEDSFDQGLHVSNIRDIELESDRITCVQEIHLDSAAKVGIDPMCATIRAVFEGDLIKNFIGMVDDATLEKLREIMPGQQQVKT